MSEFKPKWLEQIQNGSWEPELFISGGAIFSLLQLPVFIHNYSVLGWQESAYHEPILIAQFFNLAANGLIVGFILHLILRGFWVASVCLSFVFPNGINQTRMENYANPFKEKLSKLSSPIKVVTTMETVCSVVFSLSFLFFLLIVGLLVFFMVLIPHSGLVNVVGATGFLVIQILSFIGIVVLGGIYFIDFLTLGFIKKQKSIAKFYYPIYRIYSFLTLSFLYRSAYYTFISNVKKWKVLLTIFLYLAISFLATSITNPLAMLQQKSDARVFLQGGTTQNTHSLHYYEDKRESSRLVQSASIQSEIIDGNYLRLFIVHYKAFEPFIAESCHLNNENITKLSSKEKLQCLGKFYQVSIGNENISAIKWKYYTHPTTKEAGILAFIGLNTIAVSGENTLIISLNIQDKELAPNIYKLQGYESNRFIKIPFWKE